MNISVTKGDICKGRPFSPDGCPVALAVTRRTRKYCAVLVGDRQIRVGSKSEKVFDMPVEVRQFADAFDCGKEVEPFTFLMELKEGA